MLGDIPAERALAITVANNAEREPTTLSIFSHTLYSVKRSDTLNRAKVLQRRFITLEIFSAFDRASGHIHDDIFHRVLMFRRDLHSMAFFIPQIFTPDVLILYSAWRILANHQFLRQRRPGLDHGAGRCWLRRGRVKNLLGRRDW